MLYGIFQIWADHMLTKQKHRRQPTFLPKIQQLTTVCRLLCKRGEYAQGLGLAELTPNMLAQQAAKHARTVFQAARAAQCQLDTDALRIIMARCLLDGTPASLRYCSQVYVGRLATELTVYLDLCGPLARVMPRDHRQRGHHAVFLLNHEGYMLP